MKVAVIGNCQGQSIAACLNDMNSRTQAEFIMVSDLWSGGKTLNEILDSNDIILAQNPVRQYVPEPLQSKVIYFPDVTFPAFHPDMTYLRGKNKVGKIETIHSHMAHYNSSIVVYGYLRGMNIDQIISLFNKDTFQKLGYLDRWDISKKMLIANGNEVDFQLEKILNKRLKSGCFMYSFNHPTIAVMNDIATTLARKMGIKINHSNSYRYIDDPLKGTPIWPIYPEIADQYGFNGDYAFRRFTTDDIMNLDEFVETSVRAYNEYEFETIEPLNFSLEDYDKALAKSSNSKVGTHNSTQSTQQSKQGNPTNPYKNLPDVQFWKKSVATISPEEVDPVYLPRFKIGKDDKVATAGSCFAQHIARTLSTSGFNYFISESAPDNLSAEEAHAKNFGVFSARYGNIYTARQFAQLFKRVSGEFSPVDDYWTNSNGRFVDPFRPQIEPNGFESIAALKDSRRIHFDAVLKLFQETEIFIFTLGLTEGWKSKVDGAVFPLAPGVAGGEMDESKYEFVNFTVSEVIEDTKDALASLAKINSNCKIVLTVSPVPLIATYEPQHALVATTYSKSVLRVAADEIKRSNNNVDYFPSYEIITGSFNKGAYFEDDLRSVKPEGVDHAMRLFMKHYTDNDQGNNKQTEYSNSDESSYTPAMKNVFGIVCDEEAIANL